MLEAVDAVVESQHCNARSSQGGGGSPTHSYPQKQLHLHQGIIGSILGTKGSMRAKGIEDTRSIDSQSLHVHTNAISVPSSGRSKGTQGQGPTSREEPHSSKYPAGSPIAANAGLPSLPLRANQSPLNNNGFNTSSRSAHAAATTHYHSHSISHSQSSSHPANRGAGGGRGSGLNPGGEARATLGEKVSVATIPCHLSAF